MTTNEERHNILVHIFEEVFQEENLVEKLEDQSIKTPRHICLTNIQVWDQMRDEGMILHGEATSIKVFLDWANWYVVKQGHVPGAWKYLPKTLAEWQEAFTDEKLDDYIEDDAETHSLEQRSQAAGNEQNDDRNNNDDDGEDDKGSNKSDEDSKSKKTKDNDDNDDNMSALTQDDNDFETAMGSLAKGKKPLVKMSLSDFPAFDGKVINWYPFLRDAAGTLRLLGLAPLMMVKTAKDEKAHLKERKNNPEYDEKCCDFYSILSKKLANGNATCIIDEYFETQDGPLAWRDLREHYDFAGDVDSRRVTLLDELTNLMLNHNSHGGFNTCKSRFENRITEYLKTEPDREMRKRMLPDELKKALFLRGIIDSDYQATKDNVQGLSYRQTVARLYKKSLDLYKADGKQNYGHGGRRQFYKSKNDHSKEGFRNQGRADY